MHFIRFTPARIKLQNLRAACSLGMHLSIINKHEKELPFYISVRLYAHELFLLFALDYSAGKIQTLMFRVSA
jgi:hypothetical protein